MKRYTLKAFFALTILSFFGVLILYRQPKQAADVYVEATLLSPKSEMLDLVVSAGDMETAERAVSSLGGQITSRLWLIDAVAAKIPSEKLSSLRSYPGITSIVENREVQTADSTGPGGRVTDRRKRRSTYSLANNTSLPPFYLPDGGIFFISTDGKVLITNQDDTERARVTLDNCGFKTEPVIDQDGSVYLACEDKQVFALNADGSLRWHFTNSNKFFAGIVQGADHTLYVVDEKRVLFALDSTSGQVIWSLVLGSDQAGRAFATPAVGMDGTLYIATKNDPSWLFAVSPAGSLQWSVSGDRGKPFLYQPIISPDGIIYVASIEKMVYAFEPQTGARIFAFPTTSKIFANPILGPDGSLFIPTENRSLIALNPDGSLRFEFLADSGHFKTPALLSSDGAIVFAAVEENTLYAIDAASGIERWRYQTRGKIKASPTLDAYGNIVIGSEGDEVIILNPDGKVSTHLNLDDKVVFPAAPSQNGDLVVIVGTRNAARLSLLPDAWNGGPDIEPTEIKREWLLSNPLPIDVGADQLHDQGITGEGVTIAVVDSGIYFNKHVEDILGTDLDHQFLGQADFVGDGTCTSSGHQFAGYCFSDHHNSVDRYGHGSHVAGIIWSQIIDYSTQVRMGVAPDVNILSIRVLDEDGRGSYADVIEGIQFAVANKDAYNIRIMNLSISALPTSPYFADPLNRAAEQAWMNGIVVIAAAGNLGPSPETITVPGNDPYVITVGALNNKRTPGYWPDDVLPEWASSGPTSDGFIKPDVIAPGSNVISFMYTDKNDTRSAKLALLHPNFSRSISLFRMSGTSMATSVTSGVAALILQVHPELTPEQVKFRLKYSAVLAAGDSDEPVYSVFDQGNGRIWAPGAIFGEFPPDGQENLGMDLLADLANGWSTDEEMMFHYRGPVNRMVSDDEQNFIYYIYGLNGNPILLGISRIADNTWIDPIELDQMQPTWGGGNYTWGGGNYTWGGGNYTWGGGNYTWGGGNYTWGGGNYTWGGGNYTWGGGNYTWGGGNYTWGGGNYTWGGVASSTQTDPPVVYTTQWVEDE